MLVPPSVYVSFHTLWRVLDIHGKYGPWKCSEPKTHYNFAMKSVWIVAIYAVGNEFIEYTMSVDPNKKTRFTLPSFETDEAHRFVTTSLGQDIAWAFAAFYVADFMRYWAHRIGHMAVFYYTFPFSHAHHHNQIFVNPLTTIMSPMLHLASWGTYIPCLWLGYYGLQRAAVLCWVALVMPSITQHMGFDPLPWLTRINHYYCAGALPWIPLYHMYHHNPFVKAGNFGNSSVLFDYLFDTVIPESVYHIENGHPPAWLAEKFEDPEKLGKVLQSIYTAGKGKNRFEMNDSFDMSIFKTHML